MLRKSLLSLLVMSGIASSVSASPALVAIGSLSGSSGGAYADLSGLTGPLENGANANLLGGLGSGLAWAGGSTFLALPDRGPNAVAWNSSVDNTTSYISRFQTLNLALTTSSSGSLPYTLTPTLTNTTLLYSSTALNYGTAPTSINNESGKYYFTGRSDAFGTGASSLNAMNARLDPEAIRVSPDGKSVFISDEYGPYIYQFNRATGERIRTIEVPANLGVTNLSSGGAAEISGNTSGRVANKGMEGLAITPDGKTLVGFMQSALIQDGGDGAKANRIVTIDLATNQTHQYAFNNLITANGSTKSYNSSEILALNDHQFLVLERDGKGLGDGSLAKVKQVWAVDINGAQDVSGLSGEAALLAKAPSKKLFLDIESALKTFGLSEAQIPAKLEGMAFGEDIVDNGVLYHTLFIANDNDFVQDIAGTNQFFAFRFTDADVLSLGLDAYQAQQIAAVPEPGTLALLAGALGVLTPIVRRKKTRQGKDQ